MTLPGFTAEASLREEVTTYRESLREGPGKQALLPQFGLNDDWPPLSGCHLHCQGLICTYHCH